MVVVLRVVFNRSSLPSSSTLNLSDFKLSEKKIFFPSNMVDHFLCDRSYVCSLFFRLIELFPFYNIIGYASHTCNVMFGEHNSDQSRLKEKIPNIFLMRCICHRAHLCASCACEKRPRTAEELLHNVYNYFSTSAKRPEQFRVVQLFSDIKPHKLLHRCKHDSSPSILVCQGLLNNRMLSHSIFKQWTLMIICLYP